jgi:rubredoxin
MSEQKYMCPECGFVIQPAYLPPKPQACPQCGQVVTPKLYDVYEALGIKIERRPKKTT